MGRKSNEKGGKFERDVSRSLSLWLSDGRSSSLIWRSAGSGSKATADAKKGTLSLAHSGDLTAIDRGAYDFLSVFNVECKNYDKLYLHHLIVGGGGNIVQFWQETCGDAKTHNKLPMLVCHEKRQRTLLCISSAGVHAFQKNQKATRALMGQTQAYIQPHDMYIFWYYSFLANIKPQWLINDAGRS